MFECLGPIQTFIVTMIGGGIAAVYLAAGILLILAIRRRVRRRRQGRQGLANVPTPTPRRLRKILAAIVLLLAAAQTACIAYARWIEPRWLEVARVHINSPKMPPGETLRLLHISDLHCEPFEQLEPRLIAEAAEFKPDLIAFTGDCANNAAGVERFKGVVRALVQIAPVYLVRGNWDVEQLADLDKYSGAGAIELTGQPIRIRKGGAQIVLQGLAAYHEQEMPAAVARLNREDFNVLLYHFPEQALAVCESPVDLYLAGHTHGGQVALPWYGAILTMSPTGKLLERGLYRIGPGKPVRDRWGRYIGHRPQGSADAGATNPSKDMSLYINRGLGMDGDPFPRFRFLARPEITLIEISR